MQNLIAVLYVYDDGTTEHTSDDTFDDAAKAIYERCSAKKVISALGITFRNGKSKLFEFNSNHIDLGWKEKDFAAKLSQYWWPFP